MYYDVFIYYRIYIVGCVKSKKITVSIYNYNNHHIHMHDG